MLAASDATGGMNLPTPLTPLIGREREVADVAKLLRRHDVRLLTLTGPGGVGKTRLALAVAGQLGDAFSDGVRFVGLAPILTADLVLPTVAQALGMRDAGDEPLVHRLASLLGERRLLLVLDNVEHVVEATPLVADLLRACPNLKVLATSRIRLRISGEREHPVPPLAVTVSDGPDAGGSTARSEAVRLFVARAQEVREDFALTPGQIPTVAAICRRLDGLPLAIELAAARIKVLPAPALLNRLERRLPLLTGGSRDLPERQRTMANTIAWSYDLLTPPDQRLLRRLGAFVGGFDLAAAETLAGQHRDSGTGFDGIVSLVEQSLLHRADGPNGEPRYAMLETVREFALAQLETSGEEADIRSAHAAHFLALAERLIPETPGATIVPRLGVLEAEYPNLRSALEWLAAAADPTAFIQLATRLWQFWYHKGLLSEGRRWLEAAVARASQAPAELRSAALHGAGQLAHYQGDDERAVPLLRDALRLSRSLDQSWITGHALMMLGIVAEDQGQYAQAVPLLDEALTRFRAVGNDSQAALTVCHLGVVAYGMSDHARATEIFAEALALARAIDDRFTMPEALWYLGLVACERGDVAAAAACLSDALTLVTEDADPEGIAYCLSCAGVLGVAAGQVRKGTRLMAAASALREELGGMAGLPERATFERAIAVARSTLDEGAFAAVWSSGRGLTWPLASAEALEYLRAAASASVRPTTVATLGLTPRELDVLRLLVEGHSDREIGAALFLSHRTVMRHVSGILGKLGVENRTAATHYAVRHHLV